MHAERRPCETQLMQAILPHALKNIKGAQDLRHTGMSTPIAILQTKHMMPVPLLYKYQPFNCSRYIRLSHVLGVCHVFLITWLDMPSLLCHTIHMCVHACHTTEQMNSDERPSSTVPSFIGNVHQHLSHTSTIGSKCIRLGASTAHASGT